MKTLATILIGLLPVACSKSDISRCNTKGPLNDIPWLKELKEQFDKDTGPYRQIITQYTYQGETVFLVDACHLCSDALQVVYDCEKNVLCEFGGIEGKNTCPDFKKKATGKLVLYDK